MRLLLISNSTNFGETYLAWAVNQIEYFCLQNNLNKNSKIIFVPFAGVNIAGKAYPDSYDAYEARVQKVFFEKFGFTDFTSVHHFDDKVKAVKEADCIVVGGGNTFHLVAEMHKYGLMDAWLAPHSAPPTTCRSCNRLRSRPLTWCRSRSTRITWIHIRKSTR